MQLWVNCREDFFLEILHSMRRMIKFCVIYDEKQNIQEHWKGNHGMDDAQIVDLYFARDEVRLRRQKISIKICAF